MQEHGCLQQPLSIPLEALLRFQGCPPPPSIKQGSFIMEIQENMGPCTCQGFSRDTAPEHRRQSGPSHSPPLLCLCFLFLSTKRVKQKLGHHHQAMERCCSFRHRQV